MGMKEEFHEAEVRASFGLEVRASFEFKSRLGSPTGCTRRSTRRAVQIQRGGLCATENWCSNMGQNSSDAI